MDGSEAGRAWQTFDAPRINLFQVRNSERGSMVPPPAGEPRPGLARAKTTPGFIFIFINVLIFFRNRWRSSIVARP
jgi:hypothetical protein